MIDSSLVVLLAMIIVVGPVILGFAIIAALVVVTFVGSAIALAREFIYDIYDETKVRAGQRSPRREKPAVV